MTKIIVSTDVCHLLAHYISSNLYQQKHNTMEMNLSIYDVAMRYVLMATVTIIGALSGHYWLMIVGVVFFLTAILAYCPIYQAFGVNNAKDARNDYK